LASPSRTYTAPCPGCGAPVEFRSAQSAFAVCSYCHSAVVRDGETLSRVGKVAELFEDFSPLQLRAAGRWQAKGFTLVGRIQYRGGSGAWTEWHALFDDGSSGWLAEDNGGYVMALPYQPQHPLPEPRFLRLDAATAIDGRSWRVASTEQAALVAAQGELPKLPPLNQPFPVIELRSTDNEVLSIDWGSQPPQLALGRPVALEELQLTGLREGSAKEIQGGRQFNCPNCGATVEVQLAALSKSITCRSCNSIIDLSQGTGGQLAHALQDEPVQPLIPLGASGLLQGVQWQVVGYQHRMGTEPDDPDEHFGWDEYLLYNPKRGFNFLVDSDEGWSLVKTMTGTPVLASGEARATYLGTTYERQYAYKAKTSYVAGEFYWPVERGQETWNQDYAKGRSLLSMERTPREVTWSLGSQVEAGAVAKAFGLDAKLLQRGGDAGPVTPKGTGTGCGCATIIIVLLVILLLLAMLKACEDDNWRSTGTGYSATRPSSTTGGGSSGGSHK
jgi:hypothetical protein